MQIVIDIPDDEYEEILWSEDCGLHTLTRAVAKGTPLPKGHRRIIDADKAFEELNKLIDKHDKILAKYQPYQNTQIPGFMWETVCDRTTIIEADKGDAE